MKIATVILGITTLGLAYLYLNSKKATNKTVDIPKEKEDKIQTESGIIFKPLNIEDIKLDSIKIPDITIVLPK